MFKRKMPTDYNGTYTLFYCDKLKPFHSCAAARAFNVECKHVSERVDYCDVYQYGFISYNTPICYIESYSGVSDTSLVSTHVCDSDTIYNVWINRHDIFSPTTTRQFMRWLYETFNSTFYNHVRTQFFNYKRKHKMPDVYDTASYRINVTFIGDMSIRDDLYHMGCNWFASKDR